MSATGPHDAWYEELLATLRARADESRRRAGAGPADEARAYNWPEVSSLLARAGAVAVADHPVSAGGRHRGLRRALVLRLRRAIVSLLRFLTARQSEYNRGVLHALRETGEAVRSLERRLATREKEIEHLRERISHWEAHLPVEASRKAS
jgi:hypothetical protein